VPFAVFVQDRMFELCCAMNSTENNSPCADWDVYSKLRRIFTEDIATFWNVGRNMQPYISVEEDYLKLSDFHLIVYVKSPKMSNIQQNYLFSMGNQCLVKCPLHHKHLVSISYGFDKHCSYHGPLNTVCTHSASFQCPVKFCSFYVCKKHKQLEFTMDVTKESFQPFATQAFGQEGSVKIEDSKYLGVCSSDDDSSSNSSVLSQELFPTFLMEDNLNDEESIHSSADSFSEVDTFKGESSIFNDDFTSQCDDDDEVSMVSSTSDDDGDSISSIILPTTDPSHHKHHFKEAIASSIPLTVLFNKHLHVLVRRNFELKATKRMKGFLERIVATIENDIISSYFFSSTQRWNY
jgi:hypothetical protein